MLQQLVRARRRSGLTERRTRSPAVVVLSGALCVATVALLWLGYRATTEWRRTESQLADRRASEKLALLAAALDRDMKGVQLSVLVPINQEQLAGGGPAGLSTLFARAFARFPYPESFFVWSQPSQRREQTYVFNRADRPPPWDTTTGQAAARYPVVTRRDATALGPLIDEIRRNATHGKRFAAYDMDVAGVRYQVVVHLLYDDLTGAGRLFGLVGYTVNVDWVAEHYFGELARQVSQIGGAADEMAFTIAPAAGQSLAAPANGTSHAYSFPFRFFDRNLTLMPPGEQPQLWTAKVVRADPDGDPGMLSGLRMFTLMGLAALASIVSVFVIARGLTVKSELIAMKSEFVSTVTHELKTPLSLMHLVADTLVTGRYTDPAKVPEYGALLAAEVARMAHLIDNLLSFARLNRVDHFYTPAVLDLGELLEETAANFRSRLDQLGVTLAVEVHPEPTSLEGDRTALLLVLDNLLDNAIKYSGGGHSINLRGRREGGLVVIDVEDHGIGIHPDDLPYVTDKFFRGRHAPRGGSGLGLAIAHQIIADHGGRVTIRSTEGAGTTVRLTFPEG